METPDTITVVVTRNEEIRADKVDLHLTVKGSSLVTGNAALKKAKEVSQLVNALREIGLEDENISLQGIHAESSGGILGKFATASYQVRIHCNNLESLADILGVVTGQKNVRLEFLSWRYPDHRQARNDWVRACLAEAKDTARGMASALGVKLIGVHTLSENWTDSERGERGHVRNIDAAGARIMPSMAKSIDLGFPLSHSKRIDLQIETQFRVSGFQTTPNEAVL